MKDLEGILIIIALFAIIAGAIFFSAKMLETNSTYGVNYIQ